MTDREPKVLVIAPAKPPEDHPWDVIIANVAAHIKNGHICYQKWTCAGCKQRLGSEDPNVFTELGRCEHCGHVTNIKEQGCNYLLMMRNQSLQDVAEYLGRKV